MTAANRNALLSVENLSVEFGDSRVVDDISFAVEAGRTVAIVGESGSGKSVTSLSTMRLADMMGATYPAGRIMFEGKDLLKASQKEMRSIRGKEIAMIFQEPMTSLNPVFTIGDQICEVLVLHEKMGKAAAMAEAKKLLDMVRLPDAVELLHRYPHQLSGGMRKRVSLAQMLILDPEILLMDEPFSALDIQTRQLMENELLDLWSADRKSVLFITHDLEEAISLSDRVVVLSAGPATHPIGEFTIDLPRPRDVAEIRMLPRFVELHEAIWHVLKSEVLKGYAQGKR